jgi:hypothetical protein
MSPVTPEPETAIPEEGDVVARCSYCDRPFLNQRLHDLHLGEMHPETCTADQLETYRDAVERERDDIYLFHIKAVVTLGVLYTASVIGYTALSTLF